MPKEVLKIVHLEQPTEGVNEDGIVSPLKEEHYRVVKHMAKLVKVEGKWVPNTSNNWRISLMFSSMAPERAGEVFNWVGSIAEYSDKISCDPEKETRWRYKNA